MQTERDREGRCHENNWKSKYLMKAQKGNVGKAIRRRELIMNHLNPSHSWYATPKGKERKINSSQYKSHWLLSIDTVSIFCWDLSYIKCHSTHKLLFFTFSAVVPSPSRYFSIAHIFKCLHWNLSRAKKKLMMGKLGYEKNMRNV